MKVSVIIPVLNEESIISECLDQFTMINDQDTEVLVCDGGSTDKTVAIAEGKNNCKVLKAPTTGRAIQMNYAAKHAQGEVLLFLHADSFVSEDAFSAINNAMEDSKVVGGFFINRMYGQENESFIFRILAKALTFRSRISMRPYGDMGIFVRRHMFEKMNGYKNIPIMEDYEFSGRLRKQGKLVRLPFVLKTSVRRFKGCLIRTVVLMQCLKFAFNCGVAPEKLHTFYKNIR